MCADMETMTFNQMRYAEYREDEIAVTLRSSFGDYGGGSEVLVLESTQNHATAQDTEICPTLPASMGLGGLCADDNSESL